MKIIQFTFQSGEVWGIPLDAVAHHRAKWYADRDKDTTYEEEFEYVMKDDCEGIDWFFNNTDPKEFDGKFIKLKDAPMHGISWLLHNGNPDVIIADET